MPAKRKTPPSVDPSEAMISPLPTELEPTPVTPPDPSEPIAPAQVPVPPNPPQTPYIPPPLLSPEDERT